MEDIDKSNMYRLIRDFPKQCREAIKLSKDVRVDEEGFERIAVVGMGGSAIAGDFLRAYLYELKKIKIPVVVVRDYDLPSFITQKTIVFALSYSGNTEETISAYRQAVRLDATVVAVSSGGKLEELSKVNKNIHVKIPSGIPPRLSTGYLFFTMLNVLRNSGIADFSEEEVDKTITVLEGEELIKLGQELSQKLKNRIPLIYSSKKYFPVAMKWKTDINENAKTPAFFNIYPEFNHNELNAYTNLTGNFYVIIIKDEEEHPRIKKRMKITKNIIKRKGVPVTEVVVKGDSYLAKLFSAMYTGLWVSYFLALEYETDPTPVEVIEYLKEQMKKPLI